MNKERDRRNGEQKPVASDRRKEQRRKSSGIKDDTPIRRDEDWDKIDKELDD